MIDIRFLKENPDKVRENIKKKFQDHKLHLVDEVIELDSENRKVIQEVEDLRANKNKISKEIGALMAKGLKDEAMKVKEEIAKDGERIDALTQKQDRKSVV